MVLPRYRWARIGGGILAQRRYRGKPDDTEMIIFSVK